MKGCSVCKDHKLHVGDRVLIAGDVPVGKRTYYMSVLADSGIQAHGAIAANTDLVVASNPGPDGTLSKAVITMRNRDGRVMAIDEFERTIEAGVCQEGVTLMWVESIPPVRGRKVLIVGSQPTHVPRQGVDIDALMKEVRAIQASAKAAGVVLAEQIRPSVALAVVPAQLENSGVLQLCAARGIPLIRAKDYRP